MLTKLKTILGGAIAALTMVTAAQAHTISLGYVNSGPGTVTFWFGSYHSNHVGDGPEIEGSFNLLGINGNPFASTTVSFTQAADTLPTGLVYNVNNFYDANFEASFGAQGIAGGLPANSWQGVTFSGLGTGDYQYTYVPAPGASAHWASWSGGNVAGQLTLSNEIVNGVPDNSATLALMSLSIVGLLSVRRRFAQ